MQVASRRYNRTAFVPLDTSRALLTIELLDGEDPATCLASSSSPTR
jgi:hypothetical protein